MGLFSLGRRRDGAASQISKHLASLVRETLALADEDAVTISQIDCGDPACEGGAETVILVMRKGQRTKAAKISKAMTFVTDDEVRQAVEMLRA